MLAPDIAGGVALEAARRGETLLVLFYGPYPPADGSLSGEFYAGADVEKEAWVVFVTRDVVLPDTDCWA